MQTQKYKKKEKQAVNFQEKKLVQEVKQLKKEVKKDKNKNRSQRLNNKQIESYKKKNFKDNNKVPFAKSENQIDKPKRVQEVINSWDKMIVAKYYPGRFNANFVVGMALPQLPTGVFSMGFNLSHAAVETTTTIIPIGSHSYFVLAYCPSLSMYYGSGGIGRFGQNQKISGLQFYQTDNVSGAFFQKDGFDIIARSKSMLELYGSDTTSFAQQGFVWASQLEALIVAPQATVSGVIHRGSITIGQIPPTGLSITQLIQIQKDEQKSAKGFMVKGAIVNNQIVYDQIQNVAVGTDNNYEQMNLEEIQYIIIERAAVSIQNSVLIQYSLPIELKGNFAFWTKSDDTFAHSLTASSFSQVQQPAQLKDHVVDHWANFGSGLLNNLPALVTKIAKSPITQKMFQGLMSAAGSFFVEPPTQNKDEAVVMVQENVHNLNKIIYHLKRINARENEEKQMTQVCQIITELSNFYNSTQERVIPYHVDLQLTKKRS